MATTETSLDQKAEIRATVFDHLAGMVLVPTVKALWDRGVFGLFDGPGSRVDLGQIVEHTRGNRGYLEVAMSSFTCLSGRSSVLLPRFRTASSVSPGSASLYSVTSTEIGASING